MEYEEIRWIQVHMHCVRDGNYGELENSGTNKSGQLTQF